ncbi:MAG: PaaI family thioesterase [Alphaproteobacteria bacterium]|nr:PaaI family thioesterase [Alphaproteobacteria bacterium]
MNDTPPPLPPREIEAPSGFRTLVGYRLVHWAPGEAKIAVTLDHRHTNRSGAPHGGLIATIIDSAGGYAGCFCTVPGNVRRTVTLALATQFVARAGGTTITAHGRVRGGGTRTFFSTIEVSDDFGRLIATGEGTYQYRPGSETPEGTPYAPPAKE